MCADEIIDEMKARVDNFGQNLTSIIQKESFRDSKKAVELPTRMEHLTIASENTLTELYDHRNKVKKYTKESGKGDIIFP